jgi:hypothetical protein
MDANPARADSFVAAFGRASQNPCPMLVCTA